MRKLIIGLGIVVVMLLAAAIIVPLVIPATVYRDQVVSAVQGATGRQLHINGPVKLTILPNLAIEANDVALDNAPGGAAKQMATLSKLEVGVHLIPLLSGKVEISRFVLTDPVIHLEVAKDGKPNWEFTHAEPATQAVPDKAKPTVAQQSSSLSDLSLAEVKLVNGTVDYIDLRSNVRYEANQIGVTISLPGLDEKSSFDGSVTWRGKPIKASISVDRPRAFMPPNNGGSGSSKLKLDVSSELVDFSFDGTDTAGTPSRLEGTLSVKASSVRGLATVAGSPPPIGGDALGSFSLSGKLVSAGPSVSFSDIALTLDALKASGNIAIDGSGKVPVIKGTLNMGMLDVNPYLARPTQAASTAPAAPGPQAAVAPNPPAAPGQWSDAPIDLSALKAVDADLTIAADGLRYEKIEIGKAALGIALHGGKLTLALDQLQLYGGNGKGQVVADGSGAVPAIGLNFALSGIQAQSFLSAAIDLDRLTGTGQLTVDLNSRGRSQREIVGALSGKGSLGFSNGAIKGIDLAAMAKNVQQAFLSAATGGAQQTSFGELSGSFIVANGILRNDDLALTSPVATLKGSGTVDLPHKTLDYRVQPDVSIGSNDIAVPIAIKGPWDKPSYQPDLKGVLTQNAGKLLQGVLGGKGSNSNSNNNPAGLLKGLFGK
jgi:AsmA protein